MAYSPFTWRRTASASETTTTTGRASIVEQIAAAAPPTLSAAAIAAMLADSVELELRASLEIESNRLQRPTVVALDTGVLDAAIMDAATLVSGRRNPTARYAVADVSRADDTVAWGAPGADDEHPVAFATYTGTPLVRNASAEALSAGTDAWSVAVRAVAADADGTGTLWRAGAAAAGNVIGPTTSTPTSYHVPQGRTQAFTAVAYLRSSAAVGRWVDVHLRAYFDEGTADARQVDGPTYRVQGSGVSTSTMERLAQTLTYPAPLTPSVYVRTVRWALVVDAVQGGTTAPLDVDAAQLYIGDERGAWEGLAAASPSPGGNITPTVTLSWTGVRNVNRVEVHGERRLGRVTSARVDVLEAGTWYLNAGRAAGAGRLGVALDREYAATSVRVEIEETSSGPGGRVWVTEVDPMLVREVSDADGIVNAEIKFSAEAEPGRATLPVGNYRAASCSLDLDNSDGRYSPEANDAIDTGHRIEAAIGVRYTQGAETIVEMLPVGVFYSDRWDAPSDSGVASIDGVDRLGRAASADVEQAVSANASVRALLRDLALAYLDLDEDQLAIDAALDAYVLPYAYPTGTLGQYAADLAKASLATLYVDELDRLAAAPRGAVEPTVAAEIRADNALIRTRRPIDLDRKYAGVIVTARPLRPGPVAPLWTAPETGLAIATGATLEVFAPYSTQPAADAFVSAIVTSGAYTITSSAFYSDFAYLAIRNDAGAPLTVTTLVVSGTPLAEQELQARRVDALSARRYGRRIVPVEARLVQTQAQLDAIADVLADSLRGVDDDGVRRLPDVEFESLPLLHVGVGARVTLVEPLTGVGQDYQLTGRTVTYARDLVTMTAVGRAVGSDVFGVADVAIADDVYLVGY